MGRPERVRTAPQIFEAGAAPPPALLHAAARRSVHNKALAKAPAVKPTIAKAAFKAKSVAASKAAPAAPPPLPPPPSAPPASPTPSALDRLDTPDAKNVQAAVPYLTEIHQHYRETEGLKRASPLYMSKQTDINAKMREILFDWLVEVHGKFKLVPETLFMTFGLIDRYLEKEHVMRNKLQLVGVTAMFISSKYEEVFAPECTDWVYISDRAYTKEDLVRMEGHVLASLDFRRAARSNRVPLLAGRAARLAPDRQRGQRRVRPESGAACESGATRQRIRCRIVGSHPKRAARSRSRSG